MCPPQSEEELPGEDSYHKNPCENLRIDFFVGCILRISSKEGILPPTPKMRSFKRDGKMYSEHIFQFKGERPLALNIFPRNVNFGGYIKEKGWDTRDSYGEASRDYPFETCQLRTL